MKRKYIEHEIVWHPNDIKRERILIIALVTFILIFSIFAVALYANIFGIADDNSWAKTTEMVWKPTGTDWYIEGVNTDPVSGQQNELFSKMQYVGSWKRGTDSHASESILVQGKVRGSAWSASTYYPDKYWYVVSWSNSLDGPWEVISEPGHTNPNVTMSNPGKMTYPQDLVFSNDWHPLYSYWFEIKGDYKNYIKVELKIYFKFIGTGLFPETKTITDVCRMLNGVGELYIDGGTLYEEGDQVNFVMNTGFSGKSTGNAGMGWNMTIYNPNSNPVAYFDIPDNRNGYRVNWRVPSGAFQSTWSNKYTAVLRNSIVDYESRAFMTIDNKNLAPSPPTISFSGGNQPGQTIIVTLKSTPNDPSRPIDYFSVDVRYADGTYFIYDRTVDAINNQGTLSFTPTVGGATVVVEASAHDTSGRPSAISTGSIYIKHPTGPGGSNNLWWYALAGIMGMGAIGGVVYYATDKKRKYPPYRPREQYYPRPRLPPRR